MEPTNIIRPSHTTTLLDELHFTKTTDELIHFFTIVQYRRTEFNYLLETKIIDLLHDVAYRGLSDAQKNLLLKVSSEAQQILGTHRFRKIHQEVVSMCNMAHYFPLNDLNLGGAIQSGITANNAQLLSDCSKYIKYMSNVYVTFTTTPQPHVRIVYTESQSHFKNFTLIWNGIKNTLPKEWKFEVHWEPSQDPLFFCEFGTAINHLHLIAKQPRTELTTVKAILRQCSSLKKITLENFLVNDKLIAALAKNPHLEVEILTDSIPDEYRLCVSQFIQESIRTQRHVAVVLKQCPGMIVYDDEPIVESIEECEKIPQEFIRQHAKNYLECMLRCEHLNSTDQFKTSNKPFLACENTETADLLFPVFVDNLADPLYSQGIETFFKLVENASSACWENMLRRCDVRHEPLNNENFLRRFLAILLLRQTSKGMRSTWVQENMLHCSKFLRLNVGIDFSVDSQVAILPSWNKHAAQRIISMAGPHLGTREIVFIKSPSTTNFLSAHRIFAPLIVNITLSAGLTLTGRELTELLQTCHKAEKLTISGFMLSEEHLDALSRVLLTLVLHPGCQGPSLAIAIRAAFREPTIQIVSSELHFKEAINHIPIEEIFENDDLLINHFKFTFHDIINTHTVGRMLAASIQMNKKNILEACLDYLFRTYKLHVDIQLKRLSILSLDWKLVPIEIIDHVAGSMETLIVHLKGAVDREKAQRLFSRIGPKVNSLFLKEAEITDESLSQIVELCPNLIKLHISSESITSAGLATLPALKQFSQLELLCPNVVRLPAFSNRIIFNLYPQDNFDIKSIFFSSNVSCLQINDCNLNDLTPFENASSETIIFFQNVTLSDAARRQACKLKIGKGVDIRGMSIDRIPTHVMESVILEIEEDVLETHILQIVEPELVNRFKKSPRSPALLKLLPIFARKCPKEYGQQYWKEGFHELIKSLFPPTATENLSMHPVQCIPEAGHLLKIHSATLKTLVEPYAVLAAMRDKMIKNLYILFIDSAGIDQSGLGRQFITQLFEGLIQHSSTHLKFVQHQEEGYLPELSQNRDSSTIADLVTIGRIMAFSTHNHRKFPIGEIFHPLFYQVLMQLKENELYELTFDRLMELYGILHKSNPTHQQFKGILSLNTGAILSSDQQHFLDALWIEHSDVLTDDLKNAVREHVTGILKAHILPIQAIARGIRQSLPFQIRGMRVTSWNQYFNPEYNNHIDFKLQVEGELTKELFLQKVKVCIYNLPDITLTQEEKDIQDKEIAQFRSWIEEWVAGHSIAELRNVLLAITSARNLSVNIQFRLIETDGMNAHTCFGEVDIQRFFTKEEFMREMDDWGAGKGIRTISRS